MQKRLLTAVAAFGLLFATGAAAQTPAADPSDRLREVLPADVAERVLARIAEARARQLPAEALANRALKFAARGVAPRDIERATAEQAERMARAREALQRGRRERPSADEIEAGAEALRMGVDGAAVSTLAHSAPSGRSLAVPLFVIGSLVDRGLPSDEALRRVLERLQARAADADLERLPEQVATRGRPAGVGGGRPAGVGGGPPAGVGRPGGVGGGPPAGVPANPGQGGRPPATPGRP